MKGIDVLEAHVLINLIIVVVVYWYVPGTKYCMRT